MSRAKAIRKKCLKWCAYSQKEVTLCHLVDCPLWPYRFGYSFKDKRYEQRMKKAKKNYFADYQEMQKALSEYCKDMPNLPEYVQIDAVLKKKSAEQCDSSPLGINA